MTNITTLLLALTLTGAPVARVVCVTACQQKPGTSGHGHEDMAASTGPRLSAGSHCSDPSISESLYLIEQRALHGPAVLTAPSSLMAPGLVRTDAPAVFVRAADAWLKPPLVLRL